jgi:dipeptidyl aminopeptidase/acylaminoacyl peptidase
MKTIRILFSCLVLSTLIFLSTELNAQEKREVGNMVLEDVPEVPNEIKERLKQYQNTRSASFQAWLPNDEGILISTRFGNTTQLHVVNKPGGSRKQITFFDEPVSNGLVCPSIEYTGFLFTKDIGGNEFAQIYWYDLETGTIEMLTDGKSRNFGINWSNSGEQFVFTSNKRNGKDFDVYVSSMDNPKESEIIVDKGGGYWFVSDWSPDDTKLLVSQYLSSTNSNAYVLDLKTKELKQLNDGEKEAVFMARAWSKDGKNIYGASDDGKEFTTLFEYDLATDKMTYLTDDIPWNIGAFEMNTGRTKAVFSINENGFTSMYVMDLKTKKYEKIQDLPVGQVYGIEFKPEKDVIAMVLNTTKTAGDVYTLDLNSNKKTRWTFSEVGGLNTSIFPTPEMIEYETFDEVDGKKRMIPAFVYKPHNAEGPLPVMISIHGGPEGQHVPYFSSFNAYLANELGIAVIAPNVRGSSGYGKTFIKLDNGFKREESVKDIGKLIEWIESNPDFDKSKIGVYGGSYGGYMVLASMVHFGDKLKCGIDIVGISNFVTFLENTQEYRRDLRRVEYGDERDPEMRKYLESISPNNHTDKITKPLFVIQGANDPRVPQSESDQMVQSIREKGGTVWYMLAKDEGHGFRKKENRDMMTEAIALFLKENLLK